MCLLQNNQHAKQSFHLKYDYNIHRFIEKSSNTQINHGELMQRYNVNITSSTQSFEKLLILAQKLMQ